MQRDCHVTYHGRSCESLSALNIKKKIYTFRDRMFGPLLVLLCLLLKNPRVYKTDVKHFSFEKGVTYGVISPTTEHWTGKKRMISRVTSTHHELRRCHAQ